MLDSIERLLRNGKIDDAFLQLERYLEDKAVENAIREEIGDIKATFELSKKQHQQGSLTKQQWQAKRISFTFQLLDLIRNLNSIQPTASPSASTTAASFEDSTSEVLVSIEQLVRNKRAEEAITQLENYLSKQAWGPELRERLDAIKADFLELKRQHERSTISTKQWESRRVVLVFKLLELLRDIGQSSKEQPEVPSDDPPPFRESTGKEKFDNGPNSWDAPNQDPVSSEDDSWFPPRAPKESVPDLDRQDEPSQPQTPSEEYVPPPTSTSPPPPPRRTNPYSPRPSRPTLGSGSGPARKEKSFLERTIDAIRERFRRSEKEFEGPLPSPRIPSRRELDDKLSEQDSIEPGPPPPISAPGAPSPTQTGGVQSPFQKGKVLYAIPPNMKLAETIRCRVRIATDSLEDKILESGLSEEEKKNATREGIQITSVMRVELTEVQTEGPSFEIAPRNTAEQPILPFMPTEWTFDVTPKRPGHYALLLRVTAKVQIPGFGERSFDVAALDRAILVTITGEAIDLDTFEEQPIPHPTWDARDEQVVHQALLIGRIDCALERIINFVQDKDQEFHNTLLLLHFRWSDNSNQLQRKLITASDWDKVNNQVRFAITKLLAELRQHFAVVTATPSVDWKTLDADLKTELD